MRSVLASCVCALLALAFSGGARGQEFEVRSATLMPVQGVYQLNARMSFAVPEGARQAIQDGVALTLTVHLELRRARRFWLDDTVATLEQQYEVVYHALSQNFLWRNLNSGEQRAYESLDAALEALSTIRDLPVLDQTLLDAEATYEARLRGSIDVRTLPDTLRMVLFWTDDWRQNSDWRQWTLQR